MPILRKLNWPVPPREMPHELQLYFQMLQEQMEEYLHELQEDIHVQTSFDVNLQDQWNVVGDSDKNARVVYTKHGVLEFHVENYRRCWWDWTGNWYSAVAWDTINHSLAKTVTDGRCYAFDPTTPSIDIYHEGAQVMQFLDDEIQIDNSFNVKTAQTMRGASSLKWIDYDEQAAITFMSVKQNRVLEIEGSTIYLKGAMKNVQ